MLSAAARKRASASRRSVMSVVRSTRPPSGIGASRIRTQRPSICLCSRSRAGPRRAMPRRCSRVVRSHVGMVDRPARQALADPVVEPDPERRPSRRAGGSISGWRLL